MLRIYEKKKKKKYVCFIGTLKKYSPLADFYTIELYVHISLLFTPEGVNNNKRKIKTKNITTKILRPIKSTKTCLSNPSLMQNSETFQWARRD